MDPFENLTRAIEPLPRKNPHKHIHTTLHAVSFIAVEIELHHRIYKK